MLLRVSDGEGDKMRSEATRTQWRRAIVNEVERSLPPQLDQTQIRALLEQNVRVDVWHPDVSFEFAHFTSAEIAIALGVEPDDVEQSRPRIRGTAAWDPHAVWRIVRRRLGTVPSSRITSKIELALKLWPTLEWKMEQALASQTPEAVPILRIGLEIRSALDSAHRRRVGLVQSEPKVLDAEGSRVPEVQ